MIDHLLLQRGSHTFLLLRHPDRFHIIAVNDQLTEENEASILENLCSEARMDEMGLTRQTVLLSSVQSITVGGHLAGASIALQTNQKKLRFVLSDDYEKDFLKNFFSGCKLKKPGKKASAKFRAGDWRAEKQTERGWKILRPVGYCLNALGVGCFLVVFFRGSLWAAGFYLSMLLTLVSLTMYLVFPQYYTLMLRKEYKRAGYSSPVLDLVLAVAGPVAAIAYRAIYDFTFLTWMPVIIVSMICGVVVTFLLCVFSRELRENSGFTFAVFVISAFLSIGVLSNANHYFHAASPTDYPVSATETRTHSDDSEEYYCVIEPEPGKRVEIKISPSLYQQLQSGDTVAAYIGPGALGIEYCCFYGIP